MAACDFDPAEVFGGGVAVVVATVGDDGRLALSRGWAPRYDSEHHTLTLSITAPPGSATLTHLESSGAIAVTASQPLTYRTVQVKGTTYRIDAPSDDDWAEALAHLDRFVGDVTQLGLTGDVARIFHGDLRTVTLDISEMYDQTPGRGAGSAVS